MRRAGCGISWLVAPAQAKDVEIFPVIQAGKYIFQEGISLI